MSDSFFLYFSSSAGLCFLHPSLQAHFCLALLVLKTDFGLSLAAPIILMKQTLQVTMFSLFQVFLSLSVSCEWVEGEWRDWTLPWVTCVTQWNLLDYSLVHSTLQAVLYHKELMYVHHVASTRHYPCQPSCIAHIQYTNVYTGYTWLKPSVHLRPKVAVGISSVVCCCGMLLWWCGQCYYDCWYA